MHIDPAVPGARMRRMEQVRVDRWVWAVRLYKTRSEATAACRGGHVKINGKPAKAAATVRIGDRVAARAHDYEVTQLIDKRVSAPLAAQCFVDHAPPPPAADRSPVAMRDRGAGRPTKRERREIDRFRGRS
jgi:ribosome-associated heat shock protein Hsp15